MTQNEQSEYNELQVYIRNGLRAATAACYSESKARGWWSDFDVLDTTNLQEHFDKYIYCTKIALIHTEISEATEGLRKDKMDEHLPHRKSVEVELADALIRIFDLAGALNLDLGTAVIEKMAYNAVRPDHDPATRNALGGKKV